MSKIKYCEHCGSVRTPIKYGKTKQGVQRYKCTDCNKTFILNESPTKNVNNSDYTLKQFIGYMIDDVTLEVIARNLDVNHKTALYYRHLLFHSLIDYQDKIKVGGTILLDETFIAIREKAYRIVRESGKGLRGLSRNLLCIITIINLRGISVAKVSSRGLALPIHYIELLNHNIETPKMLIFDGNTHTKQFLEQFKCIKHDTSKDPVDVYNLKLLDSFHSSLKRYLFKHIGYKLKNLQHYLDFFVYRYNYLSMTNPGNLKSMKAAKNEMIEDLFKLVKENKKRITYRTFLSDEGITSILR